MRIIRKAIIGQPMKMTQKWQQWIFYFKKNILNIIIEFLMQLFWVLFQLHNVFNPLVMWSNITKQCGRKTNKKQHHPQLTASLFPKAHRHYSWCDEVCLLGVWAGQPAGPLGHSRLQDRPRQQQCNHLLLQSPHTLCHPHVLGASQCEWSYIKNTTVTEQRYFPFLHFHIKGPIMADTFIFNEGNIWI